ncbi:hypothetical protein HH214_16280 [Mucilaginibacter robiniae]|uniref:Uncharacterized protein n=1 Tax=Mucilaginibacter robiniae TaxID=2728022 RepID=A0A7L5E6B8_9SPHI|nr:hypothetical protein [Mucilaginibacter robiniae]QJD97314.1 hypothetical protein HH214_16280 [Mucilaginibacter robiniae]
MTFKSIVQTRWKVTPEQVIVYPYGVVYLISVTIALTWGCWLIFLGYLSKDTLTLQDALDLWPLYLIFLSIVVLLWLFARTAIIFDRSVQLVYKRLFGLITTRKLRFDQVQAIVPVMNVRAAYQYRVFAKNQPNDTGTIISSPFLSEQSPHAVEFQAQVLTIVGHFLKLGPVQESLMKIGQWRKDNSLNKR